jgi:FHS family L-fucose permease-like MFS transporter
MSTPTSRSLFATPDGRSYVVPFALVSSLFLLWGFCNGMIDVMDRHFQQQLHLTLAQSAWVQFAHYLGYFLMALPAGWIASRIGYKGGIVAGLLMVAAGGFWFIPATHIAEFWAFLLGVCFIAAGLTFLETVANPYTTVLGPKEFGASRINLAQSCNGIGWIFGPIAGRLFFYSTDAQGQSTGAQTLWIPYAAVAVVVVVLSVVFARANLPDVKSEDQYHLDETAPAAPVVGAPVARRGLVLSMLWLNLVVLAASVGMIASAIASIRSLDEAWGLKVLVATAGVVLVIGTIVLLVRSRTITHASIWTQPHFSAATLAQFFYVAAQSSIFAYFMFYMTKEAPIAIDDKAASTLVSVGFGCFLAGRFIGAALLKKFPAHTMLGLYGLFNMFVCLLVILKLGWVSMIAVFLSYFFMSIMFPTIFALGIFGLGGRAKKASGYIVMAIMGGAIVPKLMGHIADKTDVSRGFIVPLVCFVAVAAYGFGWRKLSQSDGLIGATPLKGH